MSYKFETEKLKIRKEDDKRIKLSDDDKDNLKRLFSTGEYSIHELSNMFGVCRRTIQFILFPERYEKNKELRELRGGSKIYYDKETQKKYMKTHRQHKKDLYYQGKLKS